MHNSIDKLTNKIYKKISLRILNKKKELKKKRFQITDANNVQMLSNIMHNKRNKKRNPYLLNSKTTYDVVSKLDFKSSYDLIWGENEDLNSILEDLFKYGLKYLQTIDKTKNELIENCLLDYLPYAKISAEFEYALEPLKPDIEDVFLNHNIAIKHLYYGISESFKKAHKSFFENKETKKLPQNINKFVETNLPNLLQKYLDDTDNQGKRAYKIMSEIMSYESEDEFDSISHGPEWEMHQPLTISERPLTEVREEVIEAGNKYIDTIVNEQKELDPFYLDNPFYL